MPCVTVTPIRVLLVEDAPGDARLVEELLLDAAPGAFDLHWVNCRAAADVGLADQATDVVLLDLGLPDGEGLPLVEGVRSVAPQLPIVVLTGRDDEALALESLRHGAQDYLRKADLSGELLARALRYAIERGRAESQIAEARDAAERAQAAKSQFLARVSHEIRTPLNTITTMAELLQGDNLNDVQDQHAKAVGAAAHTLLEVVNDILDMSKIESGKMTLSCAPFALRAALDEGLRALHAWAQSRGLGLEVDVSDDVPDSLVGDPARLRQIIANLVSNAIKFTDVGCVRLRVEQVADRGDQALLRFEVSDTGVGIPIEQQGTIFDPFTQVDGTSQRRHGGTGLGLAICHELVELMEGAIGVISKPGQGARFWFTARFRESSVTAPAPQPQQQLPPLTLLLVDDRMVNRTATAELLRRQGHRVHEAGDGVEAIGMLQDLTVDAVLMDVEMPEMDGRQATARIRRDEAGTAHRLPVVGLSAYDTEAERRACLAAGMDEFVTKPVHLADLERTLAHVTGQQGRPVEPAPPEPVPVDNASALDLDQARQLAQGDEELLRQLAGLFLQESMPLCRQMTLALEQADATAVAATAHSLRGILGQVGCGALDEDLAKLSDRGKARDFGAAAAQWANVLAQIELASDELRALCVDDGVTS